MPAPSFHCSPSPLIFLRNPSEKDIWWSKEIQLAGHEWNKPMSSRWPLSLVGSWWDPSLVPTFAASGETAAISLLFHLSCVILFIFSMATAICAEVLTLLCQVSSLLGHYSKDLWSIWSQTPGYLLHSFQEFWELQSHLPLPRRADGLLLCSFPFALETVISLGGAFVSCRGKRQATAAQLKRGLGKVA